MIDAQNPLFAPQREKAGSETKAKYAYQYHWALYRAIQEHSKSKEYAIFVELQEDVVLCDSLDASKAKFEFSQIKTTNAKYTKNALLKQKNGRSPLGKLIDSAAGKPFANKVSELNFVAISGFGIALKLPGVKLKKITISDIDDIELSHLTLAIKNELKITPLPANLQFIIPDLSHSSFQNDVIAEISRLITNLFPGSNYNSVDIYRVLMDEINRKGEITYDFTKWDDVIKNKALTCVTVTSVINQFTSQKNQAKIEAGFDSVMKDLNLNVLQSSPLKKSFWRYQQLRIGTKTLSQLDISKAINSQITSKLDAGILEMEVFLSEVYDSLDNKIKKKFASDLDARAAIICEFIMEHYGKR
jgi:hypothetical protein